MDRVVEPGIGAHTAVEAAGAAVDLAEQLNLQPTFTHLDRFHGRGRTAELGDPSRLTCPTRSTRPWGIRTIEPIWPIRCNWPRKMGARQRGRVQSDGDLCAKDVPDPADARRFAFGTGCHRLGQQLPEPGLELGLGR